MNQVASFKEGEKKTMKKVNEVSQSLRESGRFVQESPGDGRTDVGCCRNPFVNQVASFSKGVYSLQQKRADRRNPFVNQVASFHGERPRMRRNAESQSLRESGRFVRPARGERRPVKYVAIPS